MPINPLKSHAPVCVHERLEAALYQRRHVRGQQPGLDGLHQGPPRARLQVLHHRLLRLQQPLLHVPQEAHHVQRLHAPLPLRGEVPARVVQERPQEGGLVQPQGRQHPHQGAEEGDVDALPVALPLNQVQQPADDARLHAHAEGGPADLQLLRLLLLALALALRRQLLPEEREPHLPDGLQPGRLQHVAPVEVEEDAADGQHVLAVVLPHVVHAR